MARMTRTFIAVEIPAALGQKLARLQSLVALDVPGARWVAPEHFHITLAFLGDVPDTDLNAVCKVVAEAAAPFPLLEVRIERLGAFPDAARPRILWVGLSGTGVEGLVALQNEVAAATRKAGYPADEKLRFHPHVTLGRLKPGRGPAHDISPQLRHYQTWSAGRFEASEVVTFASSLTSEGPVYAPLGRAPLRGRKPPPSA